MTNFDVGNGERGKKWIENEEMQKVNLSSFPHSLSISSSFPHSLTISSFSLHFLAARMPGCHNLCNPADNTTYLQTLVQGISCPLQIGVNWYTVWLLDQKRNFLGSISNWISKLYEKEFLEIRKHCKRHNGPKSCVFLPKQLPITTIKTCYQAYSKSCI